MVSTPAATSSSISTSPTSAPASASTVPLASTAAAASDRANTVFSTVASRTMTPLASGAAIGISRPRVVPQSSSRMMTSCDTSTRRRVRYPESAVRRAVSARPLRAPCVAMKYSATDRPSRYEEMIGRGMMSPFGLFTRPRIPAMLRTCSQLPRAPDVTMRLMVLSIGKFARISAATSFVASVQILISSARRSASEIRPLSNSDCTAAACFS